MSGSTTPKEFATKLGFVLGADVRDKNGDLAKIVGYNGGSPSNPSLKIQYNDDSSRKIKTLKSLSLISPVLNNSILEANKKLSKSNLSKEAKKEPKEKKQQKEPQDAAIEFDIETLMEENSNTEQKERREAFGVNIDNSPNYSSAESSEVSETDDSFIEASENNLYRVPDATVDHLVGLIASLCLSKQQLQHLIKKIQE